MGGGMCDFVASGETNEEIKEKMWAHAGEAHPDTVAGMSEEQKTQMNERMDSLLG